MIGTVFGHYRVDAPLGAGGMGEVYLAHDLHLHRKVALKVLHRDVTADPERQHRFLIEARSASALNDPHIVTIHDVAAAHGQLYIAMEYVSGQPLDRLLAVRRLPVDEVMSYGIQIVAALRSAHAAGIIHRDIKPANIMVGDTGHVKVVDFGLAKLIGPELVNASTVAAAGTRQGAVLGTRNYMSPEQAMGRP